MLLFFWYTNQVALLLGFFLAGFTYGSIMVITPQLISECFSQEDFSEIFGFAGIAPGIAAFVGPVMTGISVDLFGNYYVAYLLGCIIMICGYMFARKRLIVD